jgi:hypothetical protein
MWRISGRNTLSRERNAALLQKWVEPVTAMKIIIHGY